MGSIKVGVQIPPQRSTFREYREAWLPADDLGADSIWNWDHLVPLTTTLSGAAIDDDPVGPCFEAWTLLSSVGTEIRRARIGCLVLSMSYRSPALLASMARTLDHATGGRLILGLGAGWFEPDYAAFGFSFGTAGERLQALDEGIRIIRERWEQDLPRPVNGTVPILVAGEGATKTLRITAQYADLWNGFGPAGRWSEKNAQLDEWCARLGRDPATIERTALIVDGHLDSVDDMVAAGCTHFIYRPSNKAPFLFNRVEELLAWRYRRNAAPPS